MNQSKTPTFSHFHFFCLFFLVPILKPIYIGVMYIHLSALLSRVTPETLSNAIFVKRDVRVKTTRTTRRENDDDDDDDS